MTIIMAAFALLISTMFIATIVQSLRESGRETREWSKDPHHHRIF